MLVALLRLLSRRRQDDAVGIYFVRNGATPFVPLRSSAISLFSHFVSHILAVYFQNHPGRSGYICLVVFLVVPRQHPRDAFLGLLGVAFWHGSRHKGYV